MRKSPENAPLLPFREKKYRNLKDALRHAVYSRPGGKNAETIAMEAGLDRLSDLSRYVSDNDGDQRGRVLDIFIPLLVALGDKGIEVHEYIGEEIRAAQDRTREEDTREAVEIVRRLMELAPDLPKAIQTLATGKKK